MRLGALYLHGGAPELIILAPRIDALGFQRFWIAENQPQPSPLLAASIAAALTSSIRIGTAGVLAHFYAPLAVAQDAQLLEMCYPGRIDLGFCSSWIGDERIAQALLDGRDARHQREAYPERIAELVAHVRRTRANPDPVATSLIDDPPTLWSMGTGVGSAALAAKHGLAFAYSVFHSASTNDPDIVKRYRDEFRPCWAQPRPDVVVATAVVCAETDDEANRLAAEWPNTQHLPRVVGSPARCRDQLADLMHRYAADEIVFADLVLDTHRRIASYQMLAEACGLEPAAPSDG